MHNDAGRSGRPPRGRSARRGRVRPVRRWLTRCSAALLVGAALSGCGTPPELRQSPGATTVPQPTAPTTGPPATAPLGAPSPGASTPAPPLPTAAPDQLAPPATDTTAVACAGEPSGSQVIAAVRRTPGLLPDGVRLRISDGPLCAGTWQYTVVRVRADPEPEPLQVVTRGRARALTVVTTGTNVCTIRVRTAAPPGIRALACDGGPGSGPTGTTY